jgi:hypothetical protein
MTADIDQLLGAWREEIDAEAEALRAEVSEKRAALVAAETADRVEKARQRTLRARIDGAVGSGPIAHALALRLEAAARDTTGGPVTRLRGELCEIERRVEDCRDAIAQLDRALASLTASSSEGFIVAGRDRPWPEDVVTEFRGGRAA